LVLAGPDITHWAIVADADVLDSPHPARQDCDLNHLSYGLDHDMGGAPPWLERWSRRVG
jgi:hypothetical protein